MKELVRGLTEKRTPQGICVVTAHYTVDPERATQRWKETERRKYTSEGAWQREQEIVFSAGGGERLFADFSGATRTRSSLTQTHQDSRFHPIGIS